MRKMAPQCIRHWMISVTLVVAACLLAVGLGGCSTSGGGAQYDQGDVTPPTVGDFAISPPNGGWRAGPCQVTLRADDNVKVASVIARIAGPGAGSDPIALTLETGTKDLYQGNIPVPANTNSDGTTNTYSITAWAIDAAGNSTAVDQSLTFTVPPADVPSPPPSAW